MSKKLKWAIALVLVLAVVQSLGMAALADGETETYKVTLSTGNVAGASGGFSQEYAAGTPLTIDISSISIPADSKYYVKGIRLAGRDNYGVAASVNVNVMEDADYVVAYGIKGELASYTVSYVDEAGNELAPSRTYYGNVGDRPVVAYVYVDGYQPEAYNITGTLEPGNNYFTFIYSEVIVPTPAPSPTPVIVGPAEDEGGGEGEEAGGEEAGEAGEEAGGAEEAGGNEEPAPVEPAAEQAAEPEQVDINQDETPLQNAPEELIDADEVPRARTAPGQEPVEKAKQPVVQERTPLQQERQSNQNKLYLAGAMLAVGIAAVFMAAIALAKKHGAKS